MEMGLAQVWVTLILVYIEKSICYVQRESDVRRTGWAADV